MAVVRDLIHMSNGSLCMSLMMKNPITGPAAWKGADMVGDVSWLHVLSAEAIASLDAALADPAVEGIFLDVDSASINSLPEPPTWALLSLSGLFFLGGRFSHARGRSSHGG